MMVGHQKERRETMRNLLLVGAILVACASLAFATNTTAELFIEIGTGACTATNCLTIDAADATAATSNTLVYINSDVLSSGWSVTFEGTSNSPNDTDPPVAEGLDVGTLAVTCSSPTTCGPDPLTLAFSDTGFTSVITGFTNTYTDTESGSGDTTQTAYVDTGNNLFGDTAAKINKNNLGMASTSTGSPTITLDAHTGKGSSSASVAAGPSAYSLTLVDIFQDTTDSESASPTPLSYSTDGDLIGVPEPGSIILFGSILFLSALGLRRRLTKRTL
jgi:hypothetical protein